MKHLQKRYETSIAEWNRQQKKSLKNLLNSFSDIIARNANDIAKAFSVKHKIDTGLEEPVVQRPRRQAKAHTNEIRRQKKKLHETAVITPSDSEWTSNVVMAKKKDGT